MSNQNYNQSLFALRINENTRTQLRGAAGVAGVAAILSLVSSILSVVSSFIPRQTTELRFEGLQATTTSVERSGNIAGAVIMMVISVLLFYFLNRFASQVKTGLNGNNQQLVTSGLGGLSAYFVTIGILVILMLLLVLVIVLAGLGR